MRLENKTALITGGNSGIGLATARLFIAEGARVAITGRNQATLDAAARELGPRPLAVNADVSEVAAIEAAVAAAVRDFGALDIVFANAGIAGPTPLGTTPLAAFERILRTNLTGVFLTVQAAAPHLRNGASVVLNGSVHGVLGAPGYSAYAAKQGGGAGDGARAGLGAVAARHQGQHGDPRRHADADLVQDRAVTRCVCRAGSARRQGRAARAPQRRRGDRESGAVPRLR